MGELIMNEWEIAVRQNRLADVFHNLLRRYATGLGFLRHLRYLVVGLNPLVHAPLL